MRTTCYCLPTFVSVTCSVMSPAAHTPRQRRGCPLTVLITRLTARWQACGLAAALLLLLGVCSWLGSQPAIPEVDLPPLLPADEPGMPRRGARNIIFIETTCAVENASWSGLTSRQACAVESCARHHAARPVHVLHTCAAPSAGLRLPAGATAAHVSLPALLQGSPLAARASSQWPRQRAAEALRFVALWKYGGLYLDLGLMVLRELTELGEDWAVAKDSSTVGSLALSLSSRAGSAGPAVATALLRSMMDASGGHWGRDAPDVITRVLAQRCAANTTAAMAECGGFRVLPAGALFPAHHSPWQLYFSREYAEETLARLRGARALRVWNREARLSRATAPRSAYATAARRHCPHSYARALHDL